MSNVKAVAYARYSSDKQQESSITVQLAAIHRFCDSHDITLVHEYVDEAQTGTTSNRKQFQQMINDATEKKFQVIVAHRMDRLARNVDDSRHYKKFVSQYGVKIISVIEDFDETPEGEFFELMSMGMAELYSKKLSREATAGKLANAREGKIHGGTPPLGYKVKGKYYVLEETEAKAVKIIFDMVANGKSYSEIKDFLNANGYRRSDGRMFTIHFYDILRNRKYIGEYVYNRLASRDCNGSRSSHKHRENSQIIRIPNGMPRIVDDDTFYQVQRILDLRKNRTIHFVKDNPKYLLSGLTKCNSCNAAVSGGKRESKGNHYTTYSCPTEYKICKTKEIRCEYLEGYVLTLLRRCLLHPKHATKTTELVKLAYIHTIDKMQESKAKAIKQISNVESEIQALDSKLTQTEYKPLYKLYSKDIENLTNQYEFHKLTVRLN